MFLAPHQLLMTVYNNSWGEARERIYVAAHWQFYEVGWYRPLLSPLCVCTLHTVDTPEIIGHLVHQDT